MRICETCGWQNDDDFNFCLGCGTKLPPLARGSLSPREITTPEVDASGLASSTLSEASPHPSPLIHPETVANDAFSLHSSPPASTIHDLMPELPGAPKPSPSSWISEETSLLQASALRAQLASAPSSSALSPSLREPSPSSTIMWEPSMNKPTASPGRLVLLLPNGQEGESYALRPDKTQIGRKQGSILFLDDPYVSPLHSTFFLESPGKMRVRDEKSLNGIFLRLREKTELQDRSILLLGKQLFLFEIIQPSSLEQEIDVELDVPAAVWGSPYNHYWGRLVQLISGGKKGNAVLLGGEYVDLGRERGQITFPGDRYISGIHARISHQGSHFFLEDLGSRNGTFLRIHEEIPIHSKDVLIIGEQLLRIELDG